MRWSISLATACHPASRNPATAGAQESACSFCGQLHIFSPPRKNLAAPKSGLSPAPPRGNQEWAGAEGETAGPAGQGEAGPLGWELSALSPLARRRQAATAEAGARALLRIVLSLQEEGKPRTNLTWFSPRGDCSPVQGCHSHTTHWAQLRWKRGLLRSVSVTAYPWAD